MCNQQRLCLSSNPENIASVESFVEEMVGIFKLSPDRHSDILITLTEAVTNAITHGNGFDESKTVSVEMERQTDTISFTISDEGHGFDPENVPDPTSPENIFKVGGRGVFLMRQLADCCFFRNNGSAVELQFAIR